MDIVFVPFDKFRKSASISYTVITFFPDRSFPQIRNRYNYLKPKLDEYKTKLEGNRVSKCSKDTRILQQTQLPTQPICNNSQEQKINLQQQTQAQQILYYGLDNAIGDMFRSDNLNKFLNFFK